jgi:hypothetical protein
MKQRRNEGGGEDTRGGNGKEMNPRDTRTRREAGSTHRVRLKHEKRLPHALRIRRRIQIRREKLRVRVVREVQQEDGLRVGGDGVGTAEGRG